MSLEEAIGMDRLGRVEDAVALYEAALSEPVRPLDLYLNLAILYWQVTDYGYWTAKGLTPEFVARAGQRFGEVLTQAEAEYPESTEVRFWRKYIAWADLGEPLAVDECVDMLRRNASELIPVMYLFASSQGSEFAHEAEILLRECRMEGTTRAQYICSVIEGVLKRSGHRRGRRPNT